MGTHISESASFIPFLKMSGVVASNNVEEEYLWSCTLSGESKEFSWSPEDPADSKEDDEADPSVKPGHRLLIKTAILMPTAMKGGKDTQQYVDLLVPCPAKLTLMQGEGPIYLVGSHCVDFYGYRDTGAGDDEDEDEATEDEVSMDEAEELVKDAKGDVKKKETPAKEDKTPAKDEKEKTPAKDDKKRKASEDQPKSGEKKKKESPAK